MEGVRRSSRLDSGDNTKVVDKATNRAKATDVFLYKSKSHNPFSVLNSSNECLLDIALALGISLGKHSEEVSYTLDSIKALEKSRAEILGLASHSSALAPLFSPLVLTWCTHLKLDDDV